MGKSASAWGKEFGKTGQEMNEFLKEHDYLEGEPGAYRVTEKGRLYAEEHHHSNGYGGYARKEWETRTWNDGLAEALRADIEKTSENVEEITPGTSENSHELEAENGPPCDHVSDDASSPSGGKRLIILGAIAVATWVVAPYVKPFYENRVKPATQQLRDKFIKQENPDGQQALEEETIVSPPSSNEECSGVEKRDE